MKELTSIILVVTVLLFGSLATSSAFAQFQSGGVDIKGEWHAGEGLEKGDFFSYSMCHVDYKECTEFGLDMWIKGNIQVGTETKWLTEVVVYDGSKRVVGNIELGKIAPEPTGGSESLGIYRGAFKSSVVWLSAFATSDGSSGGKGPKEFSAKSWGKIGNIGGEQVVPMTVETVVISSGIWDTVQVGWKTGGVTSKVWIVDGFPFPVKAKTYTHVSEGIPPTEYEFELLEYKQNVTTTPFEGIESTIDVFAEAGCETDIEKEVSVKKPTVKFGYQIHAVYGPEDPIKGCEMQWIINFINKFDDTGFLNQVQYDFLVVDENMKPIRSIAQEEGRNFLYSPSGQALIDVIVKEDPGTVNYVIWIYGLAPENTVPLATADYLQIPIEVFAPKDSERITSTEKPDIVTVAPPPDTTDTPAQKIPSWLKNNAKWWAEGRVDDSTFVSGIQFLINNDIIKIPPTVQSDNSDRNAEIPSWIKNNAKWWAEGTVDDSSFIGGIQFLVENGIIAISQ